MFLYLTLWSSRNQFHSTETERALCLSSTPLTAFYQTDVFLWTVCVFRAAKVACVKSRDMHWALVAHRDQRDINLSSLRMLVVADGSNPCKSSLTQSCRCSKGHWKTKGFILWGPWILIKSRSSSSADRCVTFKHFMMPENVEARRDELLPLCLRWLFKLCLSGSISSCDAFLNVFQSKGLKPEVICPCASSPEALTVAIRRYTHTHTHFPHVHMLRNTCLFIGACTCWDTHTADLNLQFDIKMILWFYVTYIQHTHPVLI